MMLSKLWWDYIDSSTYSAPAFIQIREAIQPFRIYGQVQIFMDLDFGCFRNRVHIEFEEMPEFDLTVQYEPEEFNQLRELDALSIDFGRKVARHIRNYRIEPDTNIKLGEN